MPRFILLLVALTGCISETVTYSPDGELTVRSVDTQRQGVGDTLIDRGPSDMMGGQEGEPVVSPDNSTSAPVDPGKPEEPPAPPEENPGDKPDGDDAGDAGDPPDTDGDGIFDDDEFGADPDGDSDDDGVDDDVEDTGDTGDTGLD